ncbi:hypothetical protein S40285_10297 [Stachybotrys chlorohalonatus IBT 40285]|uniref:Uncharacterized protein n=1 Tax=Stachybotrys chlorohalonatus (strain IBT 40285) TaxID=1283841 RepID=A0A084QS39_STAC4|nr:hypothetical protein S40285_10297 [Stachybotrys chlorohalonata IBT 40285]
MLKRPNMLFVVKDCLSSEYPVILSAIPGVHSPVHQANNATSMRSMLDLTRLYEEGEDVDANIALKRILAIADMLAAYRLPLSIPVAHFKFEPMSIPEDHRWAMRNTPPQFRPKPGGKSAG